jgi:alpha-1,3-rhamnosyl/mannosyltransferase
MPEVAGDAALLFDPESIDSIADAIRRLLGDEQLRTELSALGLQRAKQFSWQACAQGTVASYQRALGR